MGEQEGGQMMDISMSGSVTGGNGASGGIYFPGANGGNVGGVVGAQLKGGTITRAQSSARVQAGSEVRAGPRTAGPTGVMAAMPGGVVGQAAGQMSQVASIGSVISGSGGVGGGGGGVIEQSTASDAVRAGAPGVRGDFDLRRGPKHGYEINRSMEHVLGGVRVTNSQLYPALPTLKAF